MTDTGLSKRECDTRDDQKDLDAPAGQGFEQTGGAGFWSVFDLIPCGDGKARRVGTGIQPLAHGIPNRVGKLRAAGNAIIPQVAAEFMIACGGLDERQ